MIKHVSLDIDDFSVYNHRIDLLLMLKDHYPNLKVTLFTIIGDYAPEMSAQLRTLKDINLKKINENLDWLEFIPHGLTHIPDEFLNCDRETMEIYLDNIEAEFAKYGWPIKKGFKAPQWEWNQAVVDVLDEKGWWGATDLNQPQMLKPKMYYEYTHSIDTPFWGTIKETVNLHGHISLPSRNNLEDCLMNLMKIPSDAEWHFASEYVRT